MGCLCFFLLVRHGAASPSPQTETAFYLTDHLGSTRVVTNPQGSALARHSYYPYGEVRNPLSESMETPHLFTGQEYDSAVELYYYGARYYEPSLGRFLSLDPLLRKAIRREEDNRGKSFVGRPIVWNGYVYTRNNPIRYLDPTGEDDLEFKDSYDLSRQLHNGKLRLELGDVVYLAREEQEYTVTRVFGKSDKVEGYLSIRPKDEVKGELWIATGSEKGLWEELSDALRDHPKTTEEIIENAFEFAKFVKSQEFDVIAVLPVDEKGDVMMDSRPENVYSLFFDSMALGEDGTIPLPYPISLDGFYDVVRKLYGPPPED
ncbi:MAG: RHS repeat-associated core domain-containing protein [Deltaproteobacteria bacterium]|nr:RHS repeat-associated core domain-containing protein [Deltaproteobacteria bacterium]